MKKEYNNLYEFLEVNNSRIKKNGKWNKRAYDWFIENINQFIDFDNESNSGIYLIEDFYIGKSTRLIERFAAHLLTSFDLMEPNQSKKDKIKERLHFGKLRIKIIDSDLDNEYKHINEYLANGFKLTNKRCN